MLVEIEKVAFKSGHYRCDVKAYDETLFSEVLCLGHYGFSGVPKVGSRGYLLGGKNDTQVLLGCDDYQKLGVKESEVALYNENAQVRLLEDKKVVVKNAQTSLKKEMERLVDLVGDLADAVNNAFTSELQAQGKMYPVGGVGSVVLFKDKLKGVKEALGKLLSDGGEVVEESQNRAQGDEKEEQKKSDEAQENNVPPELEIEEE